LTQNFFLHLLEHKTLARADPLKGKFRSFLLGSLQNYLLMEFVEGETLESFIKGSGKLDPKLALEIVAQVTAGLTAVHKQKLVHRDIKPSNIMVTIEGGGAVMAKIIDLGLAKAVNEPGSQTAISIPGGFAGTPEFASPEQFAGVGVGRPAGQRCDCRGLGRSGQVHARGKSTLVNHWLRHLAAERYRSAESVFGWSFYRQGTVGDTSSADEFMDATLTWFGDADPRLGTAWEKGERLAKAISRERTLVVLDGLEPLQHPPGPHEGRLREPSLQALLRELAAFNGGLCVITARLPVADLADYEGSSVLRLDLDHLSGEAGVRLLQALGVKGPEAELRHASEEFRGHCLALTLLGSYLTDAFDGDIRCREEVSKHLIHDVRQGAHARKAMASYQSWFGEGPEVSTLRLLGLFDRPRTKRRWSPCG